MRARCRVLQLNQQALTVQWHEKQPRMEPRERCDLERCPDKNGGRIGITLNGSPLFTGGAGSCLDGDHQSLRFDYWTRRHDPCLCPSNHICNINRCDPESLTGLYGGMFPDSRARQAIRLSYNITLAIGRHLDDQNNERLGVTRNLSGCYVGTHFCQHADFKAR
jgi:hypothetical protein